ncbi:hypothetical protein QAD02_004019 [Eretmocerus hayati]|uniref:Uncharacterized protein n=1 Tax=Eretmocerus hayati TaxID=131215 RepID=A0ACC2NNC1_9HYME|nr:hypothetical protein QAD02_004019 [Eretmocerus hayati]
MTRKPYAGLCMVLILGFFIGLDASEDILGCGGFIESHADIDFSQISVKLCTKSGVVKEQTECAPNGYYFIPVEKGEYVLKLEHPPGWSFEPTEVLLKIDGSSQDRCSHGKDVNFVFKGFGITGKVVTASATKSLTGTKGISVSLFDQSNKTLLGSAVTSEGGTFSFTPIQPGKYIFVASHPVWVMDKHSSIVTVREGNTEVKDGELSVFGFDVSGKVTTTEGEPVGKVLFLLFGSGRVKKCGTTLVEGSDPKKKPLCHTTSDETGRFLFPAISPGTYTLVPHYTGSKTKFDVKPSEVSFTMAHDSLILPQEFKVTGFTVSGRVLASIEKLTPIPGAKVFLSDKVIAVTDSQGNYKTDNVKAKQYTLHAEADDVIFDKKQVKVSPSNPELPTISPSAYKVSGKVSSSSNTNLENRKVLIRDLSASKAQEIEINPKNGEWSIFLRPSKYELSVVVDKEEKLKGLQFFPLQRGVEVSCAPLKNINFLQLKATLKGSVVCLSDKNSKDECSQSQVTLRMVDGMIDAKTVRAKGGEYVFEEVLPGQYEVIIDTDLYCWDNANHQVVIASEKPPNVPPFRQTGYSVSLISSYNTKIEYSAPSQQNKKSSFEIPKGGTKHCVPTFGKYDFHPIDCHKYTKAPFSWTTGDRNPIILSTTEHLQSGSVLTSVAADGLSIKIERGPGGQTPIILKNLKGVRDGERYKYLFSFYTVAGESYVISPSSETLLFNPLTTKITGPEDCQKDIAVFNAEQGKIIMGSITPPLEGVSLKIFGTDKETPIHTYVTKQDGTFKVGPLDGKIGYSVTAEKEGYILTLDSTLREYKFLARKLAEIIVGVIDATGSTSLQGVLISLSGGGGGPNSYRKNMITGEDGRLSFNSLSPGEYYLRPTMKEYRFEPVSKVIRVEEGKTVQVNLVGKRVAFSAYGTVTCLNGEPEAGLVVEAKGQNDCVDLQEEAVTREDGTWRIRGLEPKCIYAIRLKLNERDPNSRSIRAIPSSVAVQAKQDVYDIKLMALQPVSRTDVSVRVISNIPENYRTLKLKLCLEDSPDSPIHVVKLDNQNSGKFGSAGAIVHFPSLQADGRKYFIQLETSLSKSSHDYKIVPIYFEANSSFKYVELRFDAERKHDHGDSNQITFVPLPLIILVTLAFFNREALSSWLNTTIEKWSRRSVPSSSRNTQTSAPGIIAATDSRMDDIIVEQIKNINGKGSKKSKPRKA